MQEDHEEDAQRIVSDGSSRKSRPDHVFIPPGERKALLSSLQTTEGMIKNDRGRETTVLFDREGNGVFVKRAIGTQIDIKKEVLKAGERAVGTTFTHNHSRSTSFSYNDFETSCWAKFGELR